MPPENSADAFPFARHSQHRRSEDPCTRGLHLAFREPHGIRYTNAEYQSEGVNIYDEQVEVKYTFTAIKGSVAFRRHICMRDLIDWFDADATWSDVNKGTHA